MKENGNRRSARGAGDKRPNGSASSGSACPQLSVVVPTKNEADNVGELLTRIAQATAGIPTEVIFVDDGDDHTPEVLSKIRRRELPLSFSFIRRPAERRGDGLGGAVAEGLRAALGEWVCVMDADLQHPPEVIPQLINSTRQTGAEICVASRYAESGEAGGLGLARFLASKLSTLVAKLFFPRRLWRISDPLSGYFLLRREAVDPNRLRPHGFKILLEILIRFPHLAVSEIPFRFQRRRAGESKAALREGIRYLALLVRLRRPGAPKRFIHFGLVGATGLAVNQFLLGAFTDLGGIHYLVSAALATVGSSLWNFSLIEAWVYRDRGRQDGRLRRLVQFLLMNTGGLLLRGPFLVVFTSGFGIHYLISNLITLLTLAWGRYLLADAKIWSARREKTIPATGYRSALAGARVWSEPATNGHENAFFYDIHGIVRIVSEVRLLELDFFRTAHVIERPDISIQIGRQRVRSAQLKATTSRNGHSFRYREILGRFGFWVDIAPGEPLEVVAGRLLKWSPHVLYTNVVEPILRWMLVRKGYALVHSACLVSSAGAVLITARTDTGKTTTILRTLAQDGHGCQFLSDDMAIVGRDGLILNYPKPLTISRHTLEAVKGSPLDFRQRLALQLQSRVHSRSGRQAALAMAQTRLPMATVNAIAQIIVPPPKYSIGDLIPDVTIARSAYPSRLVVIERGADEAETPLHHQDAMEILFRNSEDAYGFPPYPKLAPYLQQWDGVDLRVVEREIVTEALSGCPATLMRSQQLNWWQRLPTFLSEIRPDALGHQGAGPKPLEVP